MPQAGKTFRVFVSSTFDDLEEERNALHREVFPRLGKLCADHGSRFQAIDLRWGVREEAGLDQRTMRICLDELERCQKTTPRPNFIVLLGDRYGWQPLPAEIEAEEFEKTVGLVKDDEAKDLLGQWYKRDDNNLPPVYCLQPRSGEYVEGKIWGEVEAKLRAILLDAAQQIDLPPGEIFKYVASATEQEIQNGALSISDAPEHVFGFFRTIKGLPRDVSAGAYLDLDDEGNPVPDAAQHLEDLKGRLRTLLRDNVCEYGAGWTGKGPSTEHLEQLCKDEYDSLSRVIEEEIERLGSIDELEKEVSEQEAFGEERSRFFTGRIDMLKTIDNYLKGNDPYPLSVFGEGGCGKSALLAYVAKRARNSLPEAVVVSRFIGATPASSDVRALLESLCHQITRTYGGDETAIPSSYEDLVAEFPQHLALATAERPLIVFIDSLDQLSEAHDAASLAWLQAMLPEHVRIVLATRPGKELVALRKKLPEGSVHKLGPMSPDEGNDVLELWLRDAGRTLQEPQRQEVLEKFALSGNPLYLKLAFEEARLWRSTTPLAKLSLDVEGIIRGLYSRLSEGSNHGSMLVGLTLGYLASSRYGLSEDELLDILSADEEMYEDFIQRAKHEPPEPKLPVAVFSRLYYDLEPYLAQRASGGATLLTFYHRELAEVAQKDYLEGDDGTKRHLFLADYFDTQSLGPRKIEELPWQLAKAKDWERLYALLSDLPFFSAAWGPDEYDVKVYWAQVEENSQLRMVDAYYPVLEEPNTHPEEHVFYLATLLSNTGHPLEALSLREYLIERYGQTGDKGGLAASLGGQANILYAQGELDGAMVIYKEQERICRELGDNEGLSISLGNQAAILADWGNLDGAMELHKEEERICRELGNRDGLQQSLGNQALIYKARGDLDVAMQLHKEKERICRELGNKDGLGASLNNQALILKARGDLNDAIEVYKEAEKICRELGNKEGLQACLNNQALILADQGDLDGAMELHKEEEGICQELGNKDGLGASLNNQALILKIQGDLAGAMKLYKEDERICRELGNKDGLQGSLGNQALILQARGVMGGAMDLYKEQERICRELGNKDGLAASLGGQALILHAQGDLDGAMDLYKEQEGICRELGDKDGLQISIGNQGLVLKARGDLDGAMELHKEKERICREMGNKDGLQGSLGNQANILQARGDLDGAMELYKEQERICRELGNIEGLAPALANQALNLSNMGRSTDALALAQEAYDMAKDHGLTSLAQQIKPILNSLS